MHTKLSLFTKRIHDTQPEEIDCSTCLDYVSRYVDLELAKEDAAGQLPLVKQHLDQCGVCAEEYQLLRALARMEKNGEALNAKTLIEQLRNRPE